MDPDRVFIVGLSIGGVEAPLVAHDEPVRGVVVVNTVAKPFFEYLLDTRRRQMGLRRVPADEIDRRMALDELCNYRLLIEKQPPTSLLNATPACAEHIAYPAPFAYMQQWAALNLAEAWKRVQSRVLILYGTSDYISTVADDPMLAQMINRAHPSHATLKSVTDMDHYMGHASSMEDSLSNPNTRRDFVPTVLEEIRTWLRAVTDGSAPARRRVRRRPERH